MNMEERSLEYKLQYRNWLHFHVNFVQSYYIIPLSKVNWQRNATQSVLHVYSNDISPVRVDFNYISAQVWSENIAVSKILTHGNHSSHFYSFTEAKIHVLSLSITRLHSNLPSWFNWRITMEWFHVKDFLLNPCLSVLNVQAPVCNLTISHGGKLSISIFLPCTPLWNLQDYMFQNFI